MSTLGSFKACFSRLRCWESAICLLSSLIGKAGATLVHHVHQQLKVLDFFVCTSFILTAWTLSLVWPCSFYLPLRQSRSHSKAAVYSNSTRQVSFRFHSAAWFVAKNLSDNLVLRAKDNTGQNRFHKRFHTIHDLTTLFLQEDSDPAAPLD
jgi:hypothetical protein